MLFKRFAAQIYEIPRAIKIKILSLKNRTKCIQKFCRYMNLFSRSLHQSDGLPSFEYFLCANIPTSVIVR